VIAPRRRLLATVGLGLAVGALGVAGVRTARFDGVQNQWEDLLQPGLSGADEVVVVAIDRETLGLTGGWPWPRDLHASLLSGIGAADPAVVLYDVLFADPREGDDALAAAIDATPTVIGAALTLDVTADGPPVIVDAVPPLDSLAAAAVDVGHLNVTNVSDTGVVQSLPLYVLDGRGVAEPSVVLAAAAFEAGESGPLIERPDGVQVGGLYVPLDDGELRINWSDELEAGDVVSAIDVLRGDVEPAAFTDKFVLVGVTEPTLGDQHLVPMDHASNTSGVVVLANAANTILSSGYLYDSASLREALLVAVLGLAVTALFVWLPLRAAAPVSLAVVAGVILFASWGFHASGTYWNVVWPVLTAAMAAVAGTLWRYVTETRHRRAAWRMFSTYVPASVVGQLEDPRLLARVSEGARHEVTVLFCDLRGFTPIAAALEPPQVRMLLDRYYDYAVATIHRHGGTVMQFVGDEVFAVFGAPTASGIAPEQATRCALALQQDVTRLDEELLAAGLPSIRFGIGLHRGTVVAAHVGTADRRQYSVIGDTVNLGSRLCTAAGAGEIVASDAVWSVVPDLVAAAFGPPERVELKGVSDLVGVHRRSVTDGGPSGAVPDGPTGADAAEPARAGFREAWQSRRWRRLLASFTVSGIGDWLYATAFVVWLYDRTGSAAWLGAAMTARMLAYIVLGPFGGALASRWPRRQLMVGLDIARAGVMFALAALMAADGPALAGTVVVVIASVLTVPYRPAVAAATPRVVPESALAAANGAEAVVGQVTVFVGPALAGIILAVSSASVAIVVNAATFLFAAVLVGASGDLGGGRAGRDAAADSDDRDAVGPVAGGSGVCAGVAAGWRTVVTVPGLFVLNAFVVVTLVAFGAEGVLHILVAEHQLDRGAEYVGAMMAALGVGGLLISPLAGRIAASHRPGPWLIGCGVASGLPLMLLGVITSSPLALAVLAVEGMGVIVFEVLAITVLQRLAGERIAEVFGIQDAASAGGQLLGAIAAPILVAVGGLTFACMTSGGVLVAFSVLAAPALMRCGRLAEREAERIAPIADALAALGLFEGADRASVEAVAAVAVPESVQAGTVVVTEGDAADDLYVIRSGTFSAATAAHGTLRLMTAGDWFGEIGLLEQRPRTASVIAQSAAEVWRIPGDVFLTAVGGAGSIADPLRRGVAARLTLSSAPPLKAAA
jgi:class 3 adenylate cyclase/CHASE2 domain-containing sensor protein